MLFPIFLFSSFVLFDLVGWYGLFVVWCGGVFGFGLDSGIWLQVGLALWFVLFCC